MSKMKRVPVKNEVPVETAGAVYEIPEAPVEAVVAIQEQDKRDLAKVMTNDETPKCPHCGSVKIQEISGMVMGFNRWTCNNCHGSFRAPVMGKAA